MITFTAKNLHDNPKSVYQAAVQGPVKITHKFHGDFVLRKSTPIDDIDLESSLRETFGDKMFDRLTGNSANANPEDIKAYCEHAKPKAQFIRNRDHINKAFSDNLDRTPCEFVKHEYPDALDEVGPEPFKHNPEFQPGAGGIINPRFDCTPKVKSTPWADD